MTNVGVMQNGVLQGSIIKDAMRQGEDTHKSRVNFEQMKQYRQLAAEIAELEEERAALAEGRLPSSWQISERVTGGNLCDVTAETVGKMWELAELMADKLNYLIDLRGEIEGWLDCFEPEERRILRLYYVNGLTWEEVAEKVGYSSRHLSRKVKRLYAAYEQTLQD